jgi:hypothetical protein
MISFKNQSGEVKANSGLVTMEKDSLPGTMCPLEYWAMDKTQ